MRPAPGDELVSLCVTAGALARTLARHPDFKVATRISPMERREDPLTRSSELSVCVVEATTTGRDPAADRIVELCLQTVRVDRHGRIVDSGRSIGWVEDPGMTMPSSVVRTTGITDEEVRGRSISTGEAYGELSCADVVLSRDACLHRPFVEARLELERKPWICSGSDLDWSELGFSGTSLTELLLACGRFTEARRATGVVDAMLHLLDHPLDGGGTVMRELFRRAGRPTWAVLVESVRWKDEDALRTRGYRRAHSPRRWYREVPEEELEAERGWASANVGGGARLPPPRKITWKERYTPL